MTLAYHKILGVQALVKLHAHHFGSEDFDKSSYFVLQCKLCIVYKPMH